MTADETLKLLTAMRQQGARRVRIGDVEVEFTADEQPRPPVAEPTVEDMEAWSADDAPLPTERQ